MLFFTLPLTQVEVQLLRNRIPAKLLCLIQSPISGVYYGMLNDIAFNQLLEQLPGTVLEQMEHLTKKEFNDILEKETGLKETFQLNCEQGLMIQYELFSDK